VNDEAENPRFISGDIAALRKGIHENKVGELTKQIEEAKLRIHELEIESEARLRQLNERGAALVKAEAKIDELKNELKWRIDRLQAIESDGNKPSENKPSEFDDYFGVEIPKGELEILRTAVEAYEHVDRFWAGFFPGGSMPVDPQLELIIVKMLEACKKEYGPKPNDSFPKGNWNSKKHVLNPTVTSQKKDTDE